MHAGTNQTLANEAENTILLVDDEENIIRSLVRLLRRDGYKIITATGGKAGLDVLKENKVGVVLSDQRMPEMSGVEFLGQVKELYPDTVRMVLSGYTDLNSITDAINHGSIYRFLTKPWEDDLLRANIKDAFKHFKVYRENERLSSELKSLNEQLENRVEQQNRQVEIEHKILQLSQQVMDAQPIGVLGIGEDNIIAVANINAHKFLNVSTGGLLAGNALQLLPKELQACYSGLNSEEEVDICIKLLGANYRVITSKMNSIANARGVIVTIIKAEEY